MSYGDGRIQPVPKHALVLSVEELSSLDKALRDLGRIRPCKRRTLLENQIIDLMNPLGNDKVLSDSIVATAKVKPTTVLNPSTEVLDIASTIPVPSPGVIKVKSTVPRGCVWFLVVLSVILYSLISITREP